MGRVVQPGTDPGGRQKVSEDTLLNKGALKLHSGLRKAESSVLVQARTDRSGLARFLYTHKVPGIESTQCRCGAGEEAPRHMALYCAEETERRQHLRTNGRVNYQQLKRTNGEAKRFSEWMICSGRLNQFSLAKPLLYS
jgi:hypothetical protein